MQGIENKPIIQDIDSDKDDELYIIINELSKGRIKYQNAYYVNKFKAVYSGGYRHNYSDILIILLEMEQDYRDYLVENLYEISELVNKEKSKELKESFKKLKDHVSLETIRLTQFKQYEEKELGLSAKIDTFENNMVKSKDEIDKFEQKVRLIQSEMKNSEEKLNNFNTQSITILSIFAGIVMAFFGGMSFFTGVLNNIDKVTKYRLFFTVLLIGFILFNTIFLLLYLVGKISNKNIANKCKTENCNCDSQCWLINKIRKKFPMVFYINSMIIGMMLILFVVWSINKKFKLNI